jgi:hypothetical protein
MWELLGMILHNVHSQYKYKQSDLRVDMHFIFQVPSLLADKY